MKDIQEEGGVERIGTVIEGESNTLFAPFIGVPRSPLIEKGQWRILHSLPAPTPKALLRFEPGHQFAFIVLLEGQA
jgi:hypothetical protein